MNNPFMELGMWVHQFIQAAAFGAALAAATGAGAASLLDDSVNASLTTPLGITVNPGPATVVEESFEFVIGIDDSRGVIVDLDAKTITLIYSGVKGFGFDGESDTVLSLTNLSFGAGIGGIAAVEVPPAGDDPNIAPELFSGNTVAFDATSVFVTFGGFWSGNGRVVITLTEKQTIEPPVIPLPATGLLLLAGLGGLAALKRRAR